MTDEKKSLPSENPQPQHNLDIEELTLQADAKQLPNDTAFDDVMNNPLANLDHGDPNEGIENPITPFFPNQFQHIFDGSTEGESTFPDNSFLLDMDEIPILTDEHINNQTTEASFSNSLSEILTDEQFTNEIEENIEENVEEPEINDADLSNEQPAVDNSVQNNDEIEEDQETDESLIDNNEVQIHAQEDDEEEEEYTRDFKSTRPIGASSHLQDSKENHPGRLKLHEAIKQLIDIPESDSGYFVSENNFRHFYKLIHEVDIREKDPDDDNNTSLLLLTKIFNKNTPPFSVDSQANYAFQLFQLIFIRDSEINSHKFFKNVDHFPINLNITNNNLNYSDFIFKNDDVFFSQFINFQPLDSMEYFSSTKNILTDLITKAPSELNDSDYNQVDILKEYKSGSIQGWQRQSPGQKKYELIDNTINILMKQVADLNFIMKKLVKNPSLLSFREFDSKLNQSLLPTTLLIVSNNKNETPLLLLYLSKEYMDLSLVLGVPRHHTAADGCYPLAHNYSKNLAFSLTSNFLKDEVTAQFSEHFSQHFFENIMDYTPIPILKKLCNDSRVKDTDMFWMSILQQSSENNDTENMKFALNKLKSIPYFLKDICNSVIKNEGYSALKLILDLFSTHETTLDEKSIFNYFFLAISKKNPEIVDLLLSFVKTRPQLFETIKTINNHLNHTILDFAIHVKNQAIIELLSSSGFTKSADKQKDQKEEKEKKVKSTLKISDDSIEMESQDSKENVTALFFNSLPSKGNFSSPPIREKQNTMGTFFSSRQLKITTLATPSENKKRKEQPLDAPQQDSEKKVKSTNSPS